MNFKERGQFFLVLVALLGLGLSGTMFGAHIVNGQTVGERFVRRHDAARTTTANTTAADITYDTAVFNDGSGYTYTGPQVSVADAGLYLFMFDLGKVNLASTRAVGTLIPQLNGTTDANRFRATGRYLRNSGGALEGTSFGTAILPLSASGDIRVRMPGALTPTDAIGNYATDASFGGAMQLLRLPDANLTSVERTVDAAEVGTSNINTTRPWLDSSGTWTKITYNSETRDDAGLYPGTGGDITLAANTKYMIVWGATIYSTDASRHTDVARLSIDGNNVQSGSGYQRNTASQGPPIVGMYLHEVDGTADTLYLEATHETEGGDAGTPNVSDAYLQAFELPADAEWIHVDNSTTDSLTTALAGLTTWYDTPLSSTFRADGDSNLSLDSVNDAVQNDSGATLPILAIGWHRWDRDSTACNCRKSPWTRWDNGGSIIGYGINGAYTRGQQSTDDTWQAHYTSAALLDLANAADLSFQVNDPTRATNDDMGIYAGTASSRYFLGVQVLNLNTLLPTFEQSAYRWFANADSTDVGSALASQDTSATLTSAGDAFRLRSLLHVANSKLELNGDDFKLQFATKSGACDTSFSGETYADVTGATAIAYNNNTTPADGDNLTANASDPTHGGDTIVNQDYEEANNFSNTVASIPVGQDGKWDFSLIDNSAPASTSYCLRVVKSDGSLLNTYTVIPEITTASGGAVYSVSITSSGTIEYGFVDLNTSTTTLNGFTQTAQNDGNTTETLNVKSSDATNGTTWTLAGSVGTNQYTHEFSTTTGATWASMPDSATYVLADPSVAVSGNVNFDFRLTTPNVSSDYVQKSITITVQAVAP